MSHPYRQNRPACEVPTRPEHADFSIGYAQDPNWRKRSTMEDAHDCKYDFNGIRNQGFFAIFDGHAGSEVAQWCGAHFSQELVDVMNKYPDRCVSELLDMACSSSDDKICAMPGVDAGATAAVCVLCNEVDLETDKRVKVLYSANAGDTRAVLFRNGKPIRLTFDHKGSVREECERVRDAGGFIADNRVAGNLAITRSLGDVDLKEFVTGRPYTSRIALRPREDSFFIVACDGLWDVVSDMSACTYIAYTEDVKEAAHMLVDYALEQGSTDNISVMVVMFDWDRFH